MANHLKRSDSLWLAVSYFCILIGSSSTSGQESLTLKGHRGPVFDLVFSPDGKQLASASEDRTVLVWDVSTGRVVLTLRGHTGEVTAVVFSPDRKRIVTGSAGDKTVGVRVWDAESGREKFTLTPAAIGLTTVAFSSDGSQIAAGSFDTNVYIWNLENSE